MSNFNFTPEEIERCKAAMDKPAPLKALQAIASGRAGVSLSPDGRNVYLDTLDGAQVRDPESL
ncbi:MAG TPA: hypothetical protein VNM37_10320, partial [Candidatus Dormibacteraeota bacterium]|nr:hypothetical protein [Candidatus Dormibacteraeota bacterium]